MALNMDNLAGAIGEILGEERHFEDTWGMEGLKVTGTVLRADHPEWQQHLMDLANNRPEAKKTREVVNTRIFSGLAPKGFRRAKQTEAEAHAEMLRKVGEGERLRIAVFTLREQKGGIAAHLCRDLKINGEHEISRGGTTYDLSTVEGRLGILNHEIWEFEQDGGKVEVTVGLFQRGPDGEFVKDEQGEPIRNHEGGWNLGDALASLIVREAEDTAKFVRVRKADALEQSGASSIGPTGSGSPSASNDGGS